MGAHYSSFILLFFTVASDILYLIWYQLILLEIQKVQSIQHSVRLSSSVLTLKVWLFKISSNILTAVLCVELLTYNCDHLISICFTLYGSSPDVFFPLENLSVFLIIFSNQTLIVINRAGLILLWWVQVRHRGNDIWRTTWEWRKR